MFEAADGVIEVLLHPKCSLFASDFVDLPGGMSLPTVQEIFQLPASEWCYKNVHVIGHHHEVPHSTSLTIKKEERLNDHLGKSWIAKHTGALARIEKLMHSATKTPVKFVLERYGKLEDFAM